MACLVGRSSRNTKKFCVICDNKESAMEFPFAEGAKHLKHQTRIQKWVVRIIKPKTHILTQQELDFYKNNIS